MSATKVCPGTAPSESPVRLNRACTACRLRKVKCTLVQEQDAERVNMCTRCRKHSLSCVFPPAARKRTRRRNEDKLRDLESRLVAVQAVLDSRPRGQNLTDRDAILPPPVPNEMPSQMTETETLDAVAGDPVTKGLVSPELAEQLCQTFSNGLAPLYPLVSVPGSLTWESLRCDRPALFRAMITAASSSAQPTISARVFRDASQFLAEKVVVAGEKSLDLIQALLILSTWHLPPGTYTELKFSQYAHMAATMVTDLRTSNDERYAILTPNDGSLCSHELIEICRTFLAVYFLCSR